MCLKQAVLLGSAGGERCVFGGNGFKDTAAEERAGQYREPSSAVVVAVVEVERLGEQPENVGKCQPAQ